MKDLTSSSSSHNVVLCSPLTCQGLEVPKTEVRSENTVDVMRNVEENHRLTVKAVTERINMSEMSTH